MTPVSAVLRQLRLQRGLTQSESGVLLGCEQSYISALELGHRDLSEKEVEKVIIKYQLYETEEFKFRKAYEISKRKFSLPPTSPERHFEIANALFSKLRNGKLNKKQLDLITLALELD